MARNFYGVLTVRELSADHPTGGLTLYSTVGSPTVTSSFRQPSALFRPAITVLPAGLVWRWLDFRRTPPREPVDENLRIGVVGLGVGTLAAYGNPGDYIRFYEINPEVTRIAKDARYFSYLKDCRARLDMIPGDARLSMESELNGGQPQDFNLLAIDAFSGDAIPVHLLTEEAFQIYLREMHSDGIIAVHITNTYFDLRPVLRRVAERFKLHYALLHADGDGGVTAYSDWVLLSPDATILNSLPASTGGMRSAALKPTLPCGRMITAICFGSCADKSTSATQGLPGDQPLASIWSPRGMSGRVSQSAVENNPTIGTAIRA